MQSATLDRTRVRRVLEDIVDREVLARMDPLADDEYSLQADEIFLGYILRKAEVELSHHTDRTAREELAFWDRKNLMDLAANIGIYTSDPNNREKLKYLIEHSIRGDLVQALTSGNTQDKFALYNAHVLRALENSGVNVQAWLNHGGNLRHASSLNPDRPFYIESMQWKRDFRGEFAVGNVSECCISVNDDKVDLKFKPVLLDYFLDLSVQVVNLGKVVAGKEEAEKIGQLYFVALQTKPESKETNGEDWKPALGLTSLELAWKYRKDIDLIPPTADSVIGSGGYQELYGFPSTLIGHRLIIFEDYIKQRRIDISRMVKNVLRQKRQNLNQDRNRARSRGLPTSEIQEKIDTLDKEIQLLEGVQRDLYEHDKVPVRKMGLQDAVRNSESYLGTNFLDIITRRSRIDFLYTTWKDGFFNPDAFPHFVQGYHIKGDALLHKLEHTLNTLRLKYVAQK